LLQRGLHSGGALRASYFVPRSRNANPLGCARIPRYSEGVGNPRAADAVGSRSDFLQAAQHRRKHEGEGRAPGSIRPSAPRSTLSASPHTLGSLDDQTYSLRSAVSDPRRTPPRKPTTPAWAGLLPGPGLSL